MSEQPIAAHPLQWPDGWRRATARRDARFTKIETTYRDGNSSKHSRSLTIADGVQRVMEELEHLGVRRDDMVISSNAPLRLDGFPRSDAVNPSDPGAAVYWIDRAAANSPRRVMAIDQYTRLADNLAAIAATLSAMRAIERHGGAVILERAFTGFTALPSNRTRTWREVLGIDAGTPASSITTITISNHYRSRASQAHPDKGGSHSAMAELNAARDEALRAIGAA